MKHFTVSALTLFAGMGLGTGAVAQTELDFWTEFADPVGRTAIESIVDRFNANL